MWIDVEAPTDEDRALLGSALSLEAETLRVLDGANATPDAHVLGDHCRVVVESGHGTGAQVGKPAAVGVGCDDPRMGGRVGVHANGSHEFGE